MGALAGQTDDALTDFRAWARKRGRPRLDEHDRSVVVGLRLPSKQYDAIARHALRTQQSVGEVIRQALLKDEARAERDDDDDLK